MMPANSSTNTPSLGYEEDTEISKLEIAKIQLEEAIALFLGGKFLCALTLSGASEEVLSRLLNVRGYPSTAEKSAEVVLNLKKVTGLASLNGISEKELFKTWNAARNAAKHHNQKESETIVLNLFDEAYWMIRRALVNAKALGLVIQNATDFENWVIENINM